MSEKIKSIRATRFDRKVDSIMDKELTITESPLSIKEYNQEGNLVHNSNYGPGGTLSEKFVYKFEEDKLIEQITFADEDEVGETEKLEYENGIHIKTLIEFLDGSQDIITHSYDSDGNKISSTTIDDDGDEGNQEYWEYNNNKLVSYKLINEYGETEEEQQLQYDSEGNLIKKRFYNSLEEKDYYWTFEYQDKGILRMGSKYNNRDKLMEEKSYQYNDRGDVLVEKTENSKESILKEYKYDKEGNEVYALEKEIDKDEIAYEVWRSYDSSNRQTHTKVFVSGNEDSSDLEYEIKIDYEFY